MGITTSLAASDVIRRTLKIGGVRPRQMAVDVLHHDHRGVNNDAEIDGAHGDQVGGFATEDHDDEDET